MTSSSSSCSTMQTSPEATDWHYNPLATPNPNYHPLSIFCPEGYVEDWSRNCLELTVKKVRCAAKRTRDGCLKTPSSMSSSSTSETSSQPSTSTATVITTSSPTTTLAEEIDEACAARQFNVYGCLSALFNCTVLPPEQDKEDEPPEKRPRTSPPVCENNDPIPSCSSTPPPSSYPTKNHTHLAWNNRVLQKLQCELYRAQSLVSQNLLSRISSIPVPGKPPTGPVIYTTVRNHPNHRLDWDKLHIAIANLFAKEGEPIGEEKARCALQTVMELCQKKSKQRKFSTISGAKLTRWCAAALTAQGVQLSSRFYHSLSSELGCWHFISGDRDTRAAYRDLEALICSRRTVSLLRNRRSASKMPANMPTPEHPSAESADSQEETAS